MNTSHFMFIKLWVKYTLKLVITTVTVHATKRWKCLYRRIDDVEAACIIFTLYEKNKINRKLRRNKMYYKMALGPFIKF